MSELFGQPLSYYTNTLLVIFVILAGFLVYIGFRNTILFRMALRNVVRRPGRGLLIITGLMLATAIMSIAFTVGDSLTFSIRSEVTKSIRELDEYVTVDAESEVWDGTAVPETFSESLYEQIGPLLEADAYIDATLPGYIEQVVVINAESQRFEVNSLLIGVQAERANSFERLLDQGGNPINIGSLGPDEIYIDTEGAEAVNATVGDKIQLVLGEDRFIPFTIKGIADGYYFKREGTKLVVMTSLIRTQQLLGEIGQLSTILVTNRGDQFEGVQYSQGIQQRLAELPVITDNGLKLVPLKADLVKLADTIASGVVVFFTLFGLFSIGVGLLLIFLIFSMLAAERKSEMGMARAVGMQRSHLTQMFLSEGAIYGIGSAIVGALIGMGLGFLLVRVMSNLFVAADDDFRLYGNVAFQSVITAFLLGAVITLLTVYFASWRISKLNIVRAIRDIPDPAGSGRTRGNLIMGILITIIGLLITWSSFTFDRLPFFLLGLALLPIGVSLILRWGGISQRIVLSLAGLTLVILFVLPTSVWWELKNGWNDDISGFFISGTFLVTGAVLLLMNNSNIVLTAAVNSLGLYRRFTPVVKSAVAYPMKYGFRTGLSVAMFAIVVFSVVTMSILIEGFNQFFDDQERLGGGYDVFGYAIGDLNPLSDLAGEVIGNPALSFVSQQNDRPEVGTFHTLRAATGALPDNSAEPGDPEFLPTNITGVDSDFIESNGFSLELATVDYLTVDGFDSERLWHDLETNPGLAVVDASMVPTRNNFGPRDGGENLKLNINELFIENETMDPIRVTVRDLESGSLFDLTVIGVLDPFLRDAIPTGLYTSSDFLSESAGRDIESTQFFFKINPETDDPAGKVEAALFAHGVTAIDVKETLKEVQGSQRTFFNLLLGFMLLGLVVGIAALGVISARAVVERRHAIGVMRAIGFSRAAVGFSFLAESSFIAILGIGLGLILGIVTGINVISDIKNTQPAIELIIPWGTLALIAVGGYLFALITTLLPARRASTVAPAEALRYE